MVGHDIRFDKVEDFMKLALVGMFIGEILKGESLKS